MDYNYVFDVFVGGICTGFIVGVLFMITFFAGKQAANHIRGHQPTLPKDVPAGKPPKSGSNVKHRTK